MRLFDVVAVHHLGDLRKLTARHGNARVHGHGLQAQTLEEPESQDRVASYHPTYKHLFVVHFQHFDRKVLFQNHAAHSFTQRLMIMHQKTSCSRGLVARRVAHADLALMLREFLAQRLYFALIQLYFLRDVGDAALEVRGTDALVWTVQLLAFAFFFAGPRNDRVLNVK